MVLTAQDVQSVGVDTKEKIMTMNDMKEKKFYMLCSYKEVGRPVSDDELRDERKKTINQVEGNASICQYADSIRLGSTGERKCGDVRRDMH